MINRVSALPELPLYIGDRVFYSFAVRVPCLLSEEAHHAAT